MMDLYEAARAVQDRASLTAFILQMANDFHDNPNEWENITIYDFLEVMSAWLDSVDQLYRNLNKEFSEQPSWNFFAEMLMAGRICE